MKFPNRLKILTAAFMFSFVLLGALLNSAPASAAPEATFVVRTANLDGIDPTCEPLDCDLEDALHAANDNPGKDKINFNIAPTRENGCDPGTGVCTIHLENDLHIDAPLTIDGYSQPGASPNTLANGTNAQIKIVLDGANIPDDFYNGLALSGDTTIKGLALVNFVQAISMDGNNNQVRGNFIGVAPDGTTWQKNAVAIRIVGERAGDNNRVGGANPADRNLIADYVWDSGSTRTTVQGNYFGTDKSGLVKLCNCDGLLAVGAADMLVGGMGKGEGNVFGGGGRLLHLPHAKFTQVIHNNIGVGADGKTALPSSETVIVEGETKRVLLLDNTIANSKSFGVMIHSDATQVALVRNRIFNNNRLGINLFTGDDNFFGITANDLKDMDTGPNNLQNYPVLNKVTPAFNGTTIKGLLNSTPNKSFRIEFFTTPTCDAGGHGEGKTYLGVTVVTTNGNGNANFFFMTPKILLAGTQVTATATDADAEGNELNTSEFSKCKAAS